MEAALRPNLDYLVYNYFPGVAGWRTRVRSVRFATVAAATDPDADGISDVPTKVTSAVEFGWGGLVYEWNASSTGVGINTSREAPATTTFEVSFSVPRIEHPWEAHENATLSPFARRESTRADTLFGEQSQQGRFLYPVIFVPRGGVLIVNIFNLLTAEVALINVTLFTIEPEETILDDGIL